MSPRGYRVQDLGCDVQAGGFGQRSIVCAVGELCSLLARVNDPGIAQSVNRHAWTADIEQVSSVIRPIISGSRLLLGLDCSAVQRMDC